MGAKTGLLVYADGEAPPLLRQVGPADPARTSAMMRRLYPGREIEERGAAEGGVCLWAGVYPPEGTVYAASWPAVEAVGDQRVMIDRPSALPEHLVAASAGRRLVLHAMHSVVDWLAFAVWEDGRLVRSLSLSPDSGVIENIGAPLPFELPHWAGDRPADIVPWPDEGEGEGGGEGEDGTGSGNGEPYPLPFHPLDLGEEALRALCGFVMEGMPEPDDIDAFSIGLHGFLVRDPHGPTAAEREAASRKVRESMGPPRFYRTGPDGRLVEVGGLDEMIADVNRLAAENAPETTAPETTVPETTAPEQGLRPGGRGE